MSCRLINWFYVKLARILLKHCGYQRSGVWFNFIKDWCDGAWVALSGFVISDRRLDIHFFWLKALKAFNSRGERKCDREALRALVFEGYRLYLEAHDRVFSHNCQVPLRWKVRTDHQTDILWRILELKEVRARLFGDHNCRPAPASKQP